MRESVEDVKKIAEEVIEHFGDFPWTVTIGEGYVTTGDKVVFIAETAVIYPQEIVTDTICGESRIMGWAVDIPTMDDVVTVCSDIQRAIDAVHVAIKVLMEMELRDTVAYVESELMYQAMEEERKGVAV